MDYRSTELVLTDATIEALGLSLPNSSAQEAVGAAKRSDCEPAVEAVVRLIEQNIRPRDILTRPAVTRPRRIPPASI